MVNGKVLNDRGRLEDRDTFVSRTGNFAIGQSFFKASKFSGVAGPSTLNSNSVAFS